MGLEDSRDNTHYFITSDHSGLRQYFQLQFQFDHFDVMGDAWINILKIIQNTRLDKRPCQHSPALESA